MTILRVLLADSDDTVADLLEAELTGRGCHVVSTPVDHRALVLAEQGQFDAIVVALDMPKMGGAALLNCLAMVAPSANLLAVQSDAHCASRQGGPPLLANAELLAKPMTREDVFEAGTKIMTAAAAAFIGK